MKTERCFGSRKRDENEADSSDRSTNQSRNRSAETVENETGEERWDGEEKRTVFEDLEKLIFLKSTMIICEKRVAYLVARFVGNFTFEKAFSDENFL